MGVPIPLCLLLLLLLLLLPLGVVLVGEAPLVPPHLSEVHYAIRERRCELNVSWAPVQPFEDNCELLYESGLDTDGNWTDSKWLPAPFRTMIVPLGIKAVFRARATCSNKSEGEWADITLPQHGTAGTGAINISCIWHNKEYIECSWRQGKNASPDTLYNLSYWYSDLDEEKECTNYTKEGDAFRCAFHFTTAWVQPFAISIHGNSKDVQTVCMVTRNDIEEAVPVKLHPPSMVNIRKSSDGVSLNWTPPISRADICYDVEVKSTETKKILIEDKANVTIPLKSNEYHTFRVRAILGEVGRQCKSQRGYWSDWSNQVEWDDRDSKFKYLLLIFIPLSVGILTIILLVYLKRIKLLILPTIPDPGKFLKGMFEDQSEDLHVKGMFDQPDKDFYKQPAELPVKEEPTHLLIFVNRDEN